MLSKYSSLIYNICCFPFFFSFAVHFSFNLIMCPANKAAKGRVQFPPPSADAIAYFQSLLNRGNARRSFNPPLVLVCDKRRRCYQSLLSVSLTVIAFNSPLILMSVLMSETGKSQMLRFQHMCPLATLIRRQQSHWGG